MKVYGLFAVVVFAIVACGKTVSEAERNEASGVEPSTVSASTTQAEPSEPIASTAAPDVASLTSAKEAVVRWNKEMLSEEVFLLDAYKSGELATLEKASMDLLSKNGGPGGDLWGNDAYAPFLKCERAWGDLGIYASAMYHDLRETKAVTRKIVAQEKEDYEASKALCEGQLKLDPEEAWKEYSKP